MKKIVLLGFIMALSIEATSALPPANKKIVSPEVVQLDDSVEDVPLAFRVLVSNVVIKSRIKGKYVSYTLPDGKTITMRNKSVKSIDKFWKRVLAQNTVKSICDVSFGTIYEKAKKELEVKFGESDVLRSTKDNIRFEKKQYEGIQFDWMHFLFQSDGFFNAAIFGVDCRTKSDAISLKREFHELLSERYANFVDLDNGNNFESYGGIAPVPTDKNLGFAIRIDIVDYKDSGMISDKPYAVRIIYGPFDFLKQNN